MTSLRHPRVLASFPPPRRTTNPYIVQLASAVRAAGADLRYFSWREALVGRYDVVHVHWPEILVTGRTGPKTWLRRLLFAALLCRWTIVRTPVVRTVHNVAPHEEPSQVVRRLMARLDRMTTERIALNPVHGLTGPHTVILHGHYVDWFGAYPRPAKVPGRIVFAGLIRAYKDVDRLVAAFRDTREVAGGGDLSLRVVGRPQPADVGDGVRRAAHGDTRVSLDLRFLDDAELVAEVAAAEIVALPYAEMYNSGAVLMALSLDRPVLVPDNEVNRALAAEVGEQWVHRYAGALTADDLLRAVEAARARPASLRPDLSRRTWEHGGTEHVRVYRAVLGRRRAASRVGGAGTQAA